MEETVTVASVRCFGVGLPEALVGEGAQRSGTDGGEMKEQRRIYCIEGVWNNHRSVEPSVEPMLEILRRQGLWSFARRDCATAKELEYYLDSEWSLCKPGSVLYVASHGSEGGIGLSEAEYTVSLDQLANILDEGCEDCLIHFGGCNVFDCEYGIIEAFQEKTKAMGVSGYSKATGWTGRWAPALALELILFSSIREQPIDLRNGKHFSRLRGLAKSLQRRFEDCGFYLYDRTGVWVEPEEG